MRNALGIPYQRSASKLSPKTGSGLDENLPSEQHPESNTHHALAAGFGGLQAPFSSTPSSSQTSPKMTPYEPSGAGGFMLNRPQYNSFAQPMYINNIASTREPIPRMQHQFANDCISEPHTPTEQSPPLLANGGDALSAKRRFGSVSSIATTDDEDMGVNEIIFPWNPEQDELVKKIYEDLISKPNITPFSSRVPPSGIVHRVAKDTLRMAKHKKVYFPHSMDATRHRLVVLCQDNQPVNYEELQKYSLSQDYFSMRPPVTSEHEFNGNEVFEDEFCFSNAAPERKMSVEEKYAFRSHGAQLGPAFKEPQARQNQTPPIFNPNFDMTEDDIVNIVAKRKRDSLRMKRGPH